MNRTFVRRHLNACAILLFMVIYTSIVLCRPAFMYNTDGSLREFGVGQSRKTVVPAWLVAIVVGIGSYFALTYYVNTPDI